MTEADARARIAAQATDEQRRAVADVVIVNDGTLDELRAAVDAAWWDDVRTRATPAVPVSATRPGTKGPLATVRARGRRTRVRAPLHRSGSPTDARACRGC